MIYCVSGLSDLCEPAIVAVVDFVENRQYIYSVS